MTDDIKPKEGQIVFVNGGVAQYRGGRFYSGMDEPRYFRQIEWPVDWWLPIAGHELFEAVKRWDQCSICRSPVVNGKWHDHPCE
jgi:hypothetical protein